MEKQKEADLVRFTMGTEKKKQLIAKIRLGLEHSVDSKRECDGFILLANCDLLILTQLGYRSGILSFDPAAKLLCSLCKPISLIV